MIERKVARFQYGILGVYYNINDIYFEKIRPKSQSSKYHKSINLLTNVINDFT